jgi:hypothetical protein
VTHQQAIALVAFVVFIVGIGILVGLGVFGRLGACIALSVGFTILAAYSLRRG